jgi:hypothetical protein
MKELTPFCDPIIIMKKHYKYSTRVVLVTYGLGALLPILILAIFVLFLKEVDMISWAINFSCFLTSIAMIIWMINILRTELIVDDIGIKYLSPFKKISIKWPQILRINKTNYSNISHSNKYLPKRSSRWNLEIETTEKRVLKIYHFLKNIENLSDEIEKHMKIDNFFYIDDGYIFKEIMSKKKKILRYLLFLIYITMFFIFLRSNLSLLALILFVLMIIRVKWLRGKITVRILADNKGLILEGHDLWRVIRHIPWQTIKATKVQDENKGPIIVETSTGNICLWNPTSISENSGLIKLIKENISG